MLHTIGVRRSRRSLGLLLVSCTALAAAYLWAVWMGALELSAAAGPLAGNLAVTMR